jgi:H+-transporting ATPase
VLRVVRNLAMFNGVLIVAAGGVCLAHGCRERDHPLVLTAVLASIPVRCRPPSPGERAGRACLASQGVLPTRLSAVDEAASIDVLCADKTGTLTRNELDGHGRPPDAGIRRGARPGLAALASSDGGQDPVDAAIRAAAARKVRSDRRNLVKFVPFDPATKMSEATAVDRAATLRIVKGAFAVVIAFLRPHRRRRVRRQTNWRRRAFECWRSPRVRRQRCNSGG